MFRFRSWLYPLIVGLTVAAIAGVLHLGGRALTPNVAPAAIASPSGLTAVTPALAAPERWVDRAAQPLARLILQIMIVLAATRLFGAAVRRLGQPAVIGEMAAGIALGPSLFGAAFPAVFANVFEPASLDGFHLLSQVGVILFMFAVGLEFDAGHIRGQARAAFAVSHISIVFPFLLGVLAATALYRQHAPAGVSFQAFALFMGIAMSITAFPVLARILEERGLSKTPIGTMALTCAAVDDVTAWTLLAFVVAVVTTAGAAITIGVTITLAVLHITVMLFVVRPLLARLLTDASGARPLTSERIALVLGVLFASALATEIIGVHALFGAFLAGTVIPADAAFREGLRHRLESVSSVFLLPLFFAFTGLRTEIGLLNTPSAWLTGLAIVALATIGKLGGSAVTARVMGYDWRNAFMLGALMNTRGLMELIALNVGYDLGVISPEIFTMLVLMALVTTALTGPLLSLAQRS